MTHVEVSLEGDIVCGAANKLKQGQVVSIQLREAAEVLGDDVNVDRESVGPRSLPWGTPARAAVLADVAPVTTRCVFLLNPSHDSVAQVMPLVSMLLSRAGGGRWSGARDRSSCTNSVGAHLSRWALTVCPGAPKAVSQLRLR
ncbi:hypothetical protein ISCGN_018029 [Ixodes scapularis]